MYRNEFLKEWCAMNEICDFLWASHIKCTFDFVFWNSIHQVPLIKQSESLQIKSMSSSKTMTDYVQNYMKTAGLDNVQRSKKDDNVHQHKRKNCMNGRYVSKMELMHLFLGEIEIIPEKIYIKLEEVYWEVLKECHKEQNYMWWWTDYLLEENKIILE